MQPFLLMGKKKTNPALNKKETFYFDNKMSNISQIFIKWLLF